MTLRELMKWGMKFQFNRPREEDLKQYEHLICSECGHFDSFNCFCWDLWKSVNSSDPCHAGIQVDEDGIKVYPAGDLK